MKLTLYIVFIELSLYIDLNDVKETKEIHPMIWIIKPLFQSLMKRQLWLTINTIWYIFSFWSKKNYLVYNPWVNTCYYKFEMRKRLSFDVRQNSKKVPTKFFYVFIIRFVFLCYVIMFLLLFSSYQSQSSCVDNISTFCFQVWWTKRYEL